MFSIIKQTTKYIKPIKKLKTRRWWIMKWISKRPINTHIVYISPKMVQYNHHVT